MKKSEALRSVTALAFALVMVLGSTASAQTAYEYFAGYVTNTSNTPLVGSQVSINRTKVTAGVDGFFEIYVPAADKYIINGTAPGHVPHSQVHIGPGLWDLNLRLMPGEVFTINTAQPVSVTDSRGSRVLLPAGALVGPNGQPPTGPIQMVVHTYDLRTEQMVGDMSGLDINGQPVVLQSIGAISVDFTDANGTVYNLAPGKKATLSVLTDPGNPFTGAIPMWWFDTTRGVWIEEGQGLVQNGVATAEVSHFTAWNFDMKFTDPSCVKISVNPTWFYGPNNGNTVQLRVTVPSPWYSIKMLFISMPGNHAIYNVGNNLDLQVEIFNPVTGQFEPYAIVNTGAPWGGLVPFPSQYNQCKGSVTLNGVPTVGKLTGQVRRQHRSLHGGVQVQVNVSNVNYTTTTDNTGTFSVLVPVGTGSARASLMGYLSAQRAGVSVTGGATVTLPPVMLMAGDVDGNQCINTADTGAINSAVGNAATPNDPRNINGDTWIYYDDLGLAAFNGGLCGPMGW